MNFSNFNTSFSKGVDELLLLILMAPSIDLSDIIPNHTLSGIYTYVRGFFFMFCADMFVCFCIFHFQRSKSYGFRSHHLFSAIMFLYFYMSGNKYLNITQLAFYFSANIIREAFFVHGNKKGNWWVQQSCLYQSSVCCL